MRMKSANFNFAGHIGSSVLITVKLRKLLMPAIFLEFFCTASYWQFVACLQDLYHDIPGVHSF